MVDYTQLAEDVKRWGMELGFQQIGISATELGDDETHLVNWLAAGRHGDMDYMQRHGTKRSRPEQLQAGTLRVISARMDYDPPHARDAWEVLDEGDGRKLRMIWTEAGGPHVSAPVQRGFGSRLIERSARDQLGGEATVDFLPRGVVYTVLCALED